MKKNSLSLFYIKSRRYIHCHIDALKNGTCQDELSITKGVPWGENHQLYIFVNLTPPYKNAMFRFTANRFWYYVSMEGLHMPIGSFWIHYFFVRYDRRTTVKREMWMQNSVKSTTELFTFKLWHFRNNVNDLRENYWLIFSSSFICHWKVNSSVL